MGNTYKDKPNLLRVAIELSKYNDPYGTADKLLALLEGSMENSTDSNQDFGLVLSDIVPFVD